MWYIRHSIIYYFVRVTARPPRHTLIDTEADTLIHPQTHTHTLKGPTDTETDTHTHTSKNTHRQFHTLCNCLRELGWIFRIAGRDKLQNVPSQINAANLPLMPDLLLGRPASSTRQA